MYTSDQVIVLVVLGLALGVAGYVAVSQWRRVRALNERMAGIPDLDVELDKVKREIENEKSQKDKLRADYAEKLAIYNRLKAQMAIYDEALSFAELGVYEPHFDFQDSEKYKAEIRSARDQQKSMVSSKQAVICTTNWSVDGSRSKGQTMINRQIRLTLRAFNNECDAAISNTRWNNANAMIRRIENAFKQINKMNASQSVDITVGYLHLKLKELQLTHEYRETLKREKDERAEVARLAREEKKLLKEAQDAEKEEQKYQQLLEKAQHEITGVDPAEAKKMEARIAQLEADLAAAHEKSERARSMAEMTRSGYVYIISNVGSFGDEIVKIGLTRRLDPDDRVRELGDASVPFRFDTHAIIYSEDAPALEAALHAEFDKARVNAANLRKEFFRVTLNDVEAAVQHLAPSADFFKDVEAQEYRETLARRNEEAQAMKEREEAEFPAEL